jgi:DNA repair protein RadA/Sms
MRATRLMDPAKGDGAASLPEHLFILAETNLARIVEQARKVKPAAIVIDSVQMIYKPDVPAAPGSVTQLRRCCADLVYLAKAAGIAIVLVGHVTKEGNLAGPRLLEHLVDCVLSFEGDRYHSHRIVRSAKNRFGTTLEIGLFEMTSRGLREVPEGAGVPAALGAEPRPGSVVCPIMTGTRCMLVEVQALTATGFLGAAKRKSSGLDSNRLAMLIAVLEQHGGLRLADRDVFASSVGGIRVSEPASDLALLLAIAGAHYRRSLDGATAAVGEVGLGGEVRGVPQLEVRLREAARLGYKRIITPGLHASEQGMLKGLKGVEVVQVRTVGRAMEVLG